VAVAVPAGIGEDGLPVGVTLVAPAWSEGRLAAIADVLHRASAARVGATRRTLPPPDAPDALAPEETALFCVGAHMSGLALNHQLRDAGGRFLRPAPTRPEYRLHALDGRPGLARGGAGAIEGEIWSLPSAAIGPLLARVPPPLSLGTVMLGDESCLGFLAEAAGVSGAADITDFGGWRAWLGAQGRGRGDG
jgi:allophanate hydrolase